MQDSQKDKIKQELANITTPLNLPQIRQRAKSIENQMQKIRQQKNSSREKQQIKLPIIDNKSNHHIEQNQKKTQNKPGAIKSDFILDVQAKLKNVLKGMGQVVPEDGYGSYDSDDFDFQFKIKKNQQAIKINKVETLSAKQKSFGFADKVIAGEDDKNMQFLSIKNQERQKSRPKSSRDVSNDNQLIKLRNKSLITKRPRSSRIKELPNNQQIGLQTKIQYKNQIQNQKNEQINNNIQVQNKQADSPKTQEQKRQKLPKSPNQMMKLKKPKIPKPLSKSPVLDKEVLKQANKVNFRNNNMRIIDKNSRSNQKSASKAVNSRPSVPKSSQKAQNVNRVKLSPIKSQKRLINQQPLKKMLQNQSSYIPIPDINSDNKHSRTQQLKQMKIQLDKRIKIIQKQIETINPERAKKVQVVQQWMQVSGLAPKQLGKQDPLDKQLQKLQKLQNRGQKILGDYLQHRMMLMELNIHNGETEILEQVYLGEDKNNSNNNI